MGLQASYVTTASDCTETDPTDHLNLWRNLFEGSVLLGEPIPSATSLVETPTGTEPPTGSLLAVSFAQ